MLQEWLSVQLNEVMASKEALKCAVFLGSVRENNFGSRVAKFVMNKLKARGFNATLLGKCLVKIS